MEHVMNINVQHCKDDGGLEVSRLSDSDALFQYIYPDCNLIVYCSFARYSAFELGSWRFISIHPYIADDYFYISFCKKLLIAIYKNSRLWNTVISIKKNSQKFFERISNDISHNTITVVKSITLILAAKAVSISYETNVTFPNSPYPDKWGCYCSRELVSWSCFCDLFNNVSYSKKSIPYRSLCLFESSEHGIH